MSTFHSVFFTFMGAPRGGDLSDWVSTGSLYMHDDDLAAILRVFKGAGLESVVRCGRNIKKNVRVYPNPRFLSKNWPVFSRYFLVGKIDFLYEEGTRGPSLVAAIKEVLKKPRIAPQIALPAPPALPDGSFALPDWVFDLTYFDPNDHAPLSEKIFIG